MGIGTGTGTGTIIIMPIKRCGTKRGRLRITLSCACWVIREIFHIWCAVTVAIAIVVVPSSEGGRWRDKRGSLSLSLSLSYSLAPRACDFNLNGSHTHRYTQASRQCLSALTVHQNEWCMQNSYCPYESYNNTLHSRAFWQAARR